MQLTVCACIFCRLVRPQPEPVWRTAALSPRNQCKAPLQHLRVWRTGKVTACAGGAARIRLRSRDASDGCKDTLGTPGSQQKVPWHGLEMRERAHKGAAASSPAGTGHERQLQICRWTKATSLLHQGAGYSRQRACHSCQMEGPEPRLVQQKRAALPGAEWRCRSHKDSSTGAKSRPLSS